LVVDPVFKEPCPVSGLSFSVRRPALSSLGRRRRGSATLRHAGQAVNPLQGKYRAWTRVSPMVVGHSLSKRREGGTDVSRILPFKPVPLTHGECPVSVSVSVSVPDRSAFRNRVRIRRRKRRRARTRVSPAERKKREKGEGPKARKASLGWNSRQDGGRLVERSGNPSPINLVSTGR
jgi:hypothetical protein